MARCTEYEDGVPVAGRITMDEPLYFDFEIESFEMACEMVTAHWGVAMEDVTVVR